MKPKERFTIIFFMDANIKRGEIPFDELRKGLPGRIKRTYYVDEKKNLNGCSDKCILDHCNEKMGEFVSIYPEDNLKALLVTRDQDFEENFRNFNGDLHSIHPIIITSGGEASSQREKYVETKQYYREHPKFYRMREIRREMKRQILIKSQKFLVPPI